MSTAKDPDDVVPGPSRNRRGTAAAATALAILLLMGLGLSPATATATLTGSQQESSGSPSAATGELDPAVAERLAGVARDLAEAVTHGEVTEAQAASFLRQLHGRLAA